MPAIGIFASFEGGNDNTLTPLKEDKDYDK